MADFMAPPLKEKKAEDNLNYENKKILKLLNTFAGKVDRLMNMGAETDFNDLKFLSDEYMRLKEKGVDVSGLDKKIDSIKKNYGINQDLKKKGKDPLKERAGKEKEA